MHIAGSFSFTAGQTKELTELLGGCPNELRCTADSNASARDCGRLTQTIESRVESLKIREAVESCRTHPPETRRGSDPESSYTRGVSTGWAFRTHRSTALTPKRKEIGQRKLEGVHQGVVCIMRNRGPQEVNGRGLILRTARKPSVTFDADRFHG